MISIDITSDYAYALWGNKQGKKVVIKEARAVKLPKSLLNSEEEVDVDRLVDVLKELTTGISDKEVTITLSNSTVVSSEYVLPYDKKIMNMKNILWGEVSQTVSEQTHIIDYKVLEIFTENKAQMCRLQAYITKRSTVMDVGFAIKSIGKEPLCYNIAGNCIDGLVRFFYYSKPLMLASLTADLIKVHLFMPPNRILTRTASVKPEEDLSVLGIEVTFDENAFNDSASDQISKMIQFAAIKYPNIEIDQIFIFGNLANEQSEEYLTQSLSRNVSLLAMPDNLVASKAFEVEKFAYALGGLV